MLTAEFQLHFPINPQHAPASPAFALQANDIVVFIKPSRRQLLDQLVKPVDYLRIILPNTIPQVLSGGWALQLFFNDLFGQLVIQHQFGVHLL